jgi:1-acyl-sn-glycerol-3-phosphate acyltransferase
MNRILSWLCKIFFTPLIGIFFIKEAKGRKNIPRKNFILVSNHQSHLDIILCGWLCVPRRFTYIGQVDEYQGVQGFLRNFFYFLAGVIPVNRNDKTSRKTATRKAISSLKEGKILVIYPEGTRSRTGEIQEGKWGVAKIFLKTGVPILPVGIKGTFQLMPPGKSFPKLKKVVRINIGEPLFFKEQFEKAQKLDESSEEYKNLYREITNKTMEEIKNLVMP